MHFCVEKVQTSSVTFGDTFPRGEGIWSLQYNLKTDQWADRFLDAYGRDKLNPQLLDSIRAFEVFL